MEKATTKTGGDVDRDSLLPGGSAVLTVRIHPSPLRQARSWYPDRLPPLQVDARTSRRTGPSASRIRQAHGIWRSRWQSRTSLSPPEIRFVIHGATGITPVSGRRDEAPRFPDTISATRGDGLYP